MSFALDILLNILYIAITYRIHLFNCIIFICQPGRGGIIIETERIAGRTVSEATLTSVTMKDAGKYSCRPTEGKMDSVILIVDQGKFHIYIIKIFKLKFPLVYINNFSITHYILNCNNFSFFCIYIYLDGNM